MPKMLVFVIFRQKSFSCFLVPCNFVSSLIPWKYSLKYSSVIITIRNLSQLFVTIRCFHIATEIRRCAFHSFLEFLKNKNGLSETHEPQVTTPDADGIFSRVGAFFLAPLKIDNFSVKKIQIHHVSKAKTYSEL